MSDQIRLNLDDAPAWDVTIVVRGVDVPMLSPLETAEASVAFRPCALVRLANWLLGDHLPRWLRHRQAANETAAARRLVKLATPRAFHDLVDQLTGGELVRIFSIYSGAQQEWAERHARWARTKAAAATGGEATAPLASRPAARPCVQPSAAMPGRQQLLTPPVPLTHSGPLPQALTVHLDAARQRDGEETRQGQGSKGGVTAGEGGIEA